MTAETPAAAVNADTQRLHDMGYAQELNRKMGWFSNFAISFSIISILAGAMTTYWLGMQAGGPRAIMLSWIGPKIQGTKEELMAIEHELESGRV